MVQWLHRRRWLLRGREAGLIDTFVSRAGRGAAIRMTPKQLAWLEAIFERAWAEEAAA